MTRLRTPALVCGLIGLAAVQVTGPPQDEAPQDEAARMPDQVPRGPFGLSRISTPGGEPVSIDDFYLSSDCALCHPRQWKEMKGSMHSVAHEDPFYRRFAEMARREAGEEVYTYCSGCHSPAGVVSGLIPGMDEHALPEQAKAGVTCDVCHQVSELTGHAGPWKEPGNASFVITPGRVKFGPYDDIERNPAHTGKQADYLASSEFCASCHTIIHPTNGLRIEHTYDEWKKSVYAEKGIQCQDCHMRSVEDARQVAKTLAPVEVRGELSRKGAERLISPHFFVGGNVEADILAGSVSHSRIAEARLKSAATLDLKAPDEVQPGQELAFEVVVNNIGAGHNLPTSLTELRQMWVHAVVRSGDEVLYETGALDDHGEILPGAMQFGAGLVDAEGHHTYKPWEAAEFEWFRTVPPKGSDAQRFAFPVPVEAAQALTIEARLLYRIAPPHVVDEVMGSETFVPKIVEMATARASLQLTGGSR